jgi:hypothetical protein
VGGRGGGDAEAGEAEQALLALPAPRRYRYFLEQLAATGEAWGLWEEGWALSVDAAERDILPLWPSRGTAERCATRLWEGYAARPLPLAELTGTVLPELEASGMGLVAFSTPDGHGHPVTPARLREDLAQARARLPSA